MERHYDKHIVYHACMLSVLCADPLRLCSEQVAVGQAEPVAWVGADQPQSLPACSSTQHAYVKESENRLMRPGMSKAI